MRKLIHVLPAKIATTLQDLDAANRSRVAAFLSCEGGDCIEHKPERLETMFADGVRSIQLVHYAQNQIGDLQSSSPKFNGLSAVGKEIVIGMDRLGMVIDVAHATAKTVQDVLHISDLPIILSHSQLKRGKNQHPRLITKDHARLVADSGGVIGMWPSGFGNATFDEFVDNTLRLIDVVGVEHVGLGTDMDGNYKPVFDSYLQLPDWVEALFAKGLTEHEVNLVVGGNVHNLLQKVLK
jgi:membrane dipeptidase